MKFNFFKKIWGKRDDKEEIISENKENVESKEDKSLNIRIEKTEGLYLLPLISEKSMKLAKENKYVFLIHNSDRKVNKNVIKDSIEKMFKVNVVKIATSNFKRRERGRSKLKTVRPSFKKVFVTLKKDQTIPIFE
jgi:large subunit ribosomal protein L23